jgi:hypothetical protein
MQVGRSTRSAEVTNQNQDVTPVEEVKNESGDSSDFEAILRSAVSPDQANQINEEELFSGIVFERIKTLKGEDAAKQYKELLETQKSLLKKADGYIPLEDAAKNALKSLRDSAQLTADEANNIYSESFDAAQLDSNTEALYDGRGGANDPTIALSLLESALSSSRLMIEKFTSGDLKASARSLDDSSVGGLKIQSTGDASTGNTFDGADGFLFKPESVNQGTLAVLLPEALANQVMSLVLKDENGNDIEEGNSTGYGELGTREKFSFSKKGGEYGDNITVKALLSDGTTREWLIPDGSQRYD